MHINYLYCLEWANRVNDQDPGAKILDYGCGVGKVVEEGRKRGMDLYGSDVFYRDTIRVKAARTGLLGTYIREMKDDRIDFEDDTFDLVLSNQVFEHVSDLSATLAEVRRVLRPGGLLLALFPSREVWREGHFGIPFSHKMRPGSRFRYAYTFALRWLGFGRFKGKLTPREWARTKLDWIDTFCYYRPYQEIHTVFNEFFKFERIEPDYLDYRLRTGSRLIRTPGRIFLGMPGGKQLAQAVFFRLAGLIFLARKV